MVSPSRIIVTFLDTPAYGGAETYIHRVHQLLADKDTLCILATNNREVVKKTPVGISVVSLPYRLDAIGNIRGLIKFFFALPGSMFWCYRWMHQLRSDYPKAQICCLFVGFSDRLVFSWLVKRFGCRLLWLEYGPLEPTFARNFGFPKLLYAFGRPWVDRIVTISDWTVRSLLTTGKIKAKLLTRIYPGVQIPNQQARQNRHVKKVLAIARLAHEKEIDLLLRAWARSSLRHSAQLLVVGDGPAREELTQLARSLGIASSVVFTGFIEEKQKLYYLRNADLFVFPSAWSLEGFGMTTIEALAYGVPVISSGDGPQQEIIRHKENGWIFRPHTVEALAAVLDAVATDPDRHKVANAGHLDALEHFSIEQMQKSWRAIIDEVFTLSTVDSSRI